MALAPKLELRQGQSLVMTPQLQQAIKLLQMSNLELQVFVEQELERNPLLDRDERDESGEARAAAENKGSDEKAGDDKEREVLHPLDEPARETGDEVTPSADQEMKPAAGGMMDSGWSSLREGAGVPFGE